MKKKAFAIVCAIMFAMISVSGCSFENDEALSSTSTSKYKLFETTKSEAYLGFLENFDYTNNEIINISISTQGTDYATTYFVTYKDISEEHTADEDFS